MSAPKMPAQHRTNVASRIVTRAIQALGACLEDEEDPIQRFAGALMQIAEEELKAQPGSVGKQIQMDAIANHLNGARSEALLQREALAMVLEHLIHGRVTMNDRRQTAAGALGVELERSGIVVAS